MVSLTDRSGSRRSMVTGDLRARLRAAPRPVLMGVAGDSGSGKSTYSQGIQRLLGADLVTTISLDGYHKETRAQRRQSGRTPLDPKANRLKTARDHLEAIREGRPVDIPVYNHSSGEFDPPVPFRPKPVVVVEGLHALYPEFLPLLDFTVFVDSDRQVKWRWKFDRDVGRRGYDPDEARRELRPREAAYKRWIDFQKTSADVVVKLHRSEMASLAVQEYQGQLPEDYYHIELIVSPIRTVLPSLYLPVDLNTMTHERAMPFMLANVPSSYWGRPVNVVHVDGAVTPDALCQLEAEMMRLAGIPTGEARLGPVVDQPSTKLFTQLLVTWPFLGHVSALLEEAAKPDCDTANNSQGS